MAKPSKGLLWTGILCGLLAVGAYFLAREQERIRSKFGDAPQQITLAELAEKGCGDNVWVDLTEVELLPQHVVQTRKGTISAVWVAALPQGQGDNAEEIKVILRSTRCRSEHEIPQKFEPRDSYRGAVINALLLQPHDPYRPLLQQAFPNLKLAPTIWEVDIDYHKPSEKWSAGFDFAAAGLTFVGALCGAAWSLRFGKPVTADKQWDRAELQTSLRE
jgi:hypothetical protein